MRRRLQNGHHRPPHATLHSVVLRQRSGCTSGTKPPLRPAFAARTVLRSFCSILLHRRCAITCLFSVASVRFLQIKNEKSVRLVGSGLTPGLGGLPTSLLFSSAPNSEPRQC